MNVDPREYDDDEFNDDLDDNIDDDDLSDVDLDEDVDLDDLDDDDSDYSVNPNLDMETVFKLNTNKHKREGRHRLKRDTIFKGKLEEKQEYEFLEGEYYNDIIYKVETDSIFEQETRYNEDYISQNNLKKDVYDLLDQQTGLDFNQNRRKPNKETFNRYFEMLMSELGHRYTSSEVFVELAYYFTDNIFNMFKLLELKAANVIVKELDKKGYLDDIKGVNFQ